MFVIFGWRKETVEVDCALRCHCYRCQRTRAWEHWRETEWVELFLIKVLPFLMRHHVRCAACRQGVALDGRRARRLAARQQLDAITEHVETLQLADKSEVQRRFLLAQRETRDPG